MPSWLALAKVPRLVPLARVVALPVPRRIAEVSRQQAHPEWEELASQVRAVLPRPQLRERAPPPFPLAARQLAALLRPVQELAGGLLEALPLVVRVSPGV